MKKWVALTICATMVMISACSGGKNVPDPQNGGNASGKDPAATSSDAPKSDVTLSLWHFKVAFDPGFAAVAEAFEQKTGIKVETQVTTPDDAYRQKLTAAATTQNAPDLYMYWAAPAEGAYDGMAYEWSGDLESDAAWRDSFFPSALSGVQVTQDYIDAWKKEDAISAWKKNETKPGQVYGIPLDVGSFYTIYGNKKILEEAGVATDAPATMEEWLERMQAVKAKADKPGLVLAGNTFAVYENWFVNFVDYMKNGPESFEAFMMREEKMSDPKHAHVAEFIETITKENLLMPGAVALDIDPADQAFSQEQAAYLLGGTFTYASLSAMGMNMDDVISFRVPAYKDSVEPDAKVNPFPLVSMVVNSKGQHVEEAVEFVKFLTSEEGMILYANKAFDIPAVNIEDKEALLPAINSMMSSLSMEPNWFFSNPHVVGKFGNQEWIGFHDNKQRMMLGELTAEQAAEQFDKDAAAEKAKEK